MKNINKKSNEQTTQKSFSPPEFLDEIDEYKNETNKLYDLISSENQNVSIKHLNKEMTEICSKLVKNEHFLILKF